MKTEHAVVIAFKCICGKLYCAAFIGPNSKCTCSRELYQQAFNTVKIRQFHYAFI